MFENEIDPKLPRLQDADVMGKVVLVRVDHNVVKKGVIIDPYRIDATLGTLYNIVERGGRPILMTHVGRPKNKKTGEIEITDGSSVAPIVEYLNRKLNTTFVIPEFQSIKGVGISNILSSIKPYIRDLKERKISGIYLPNTRWFAGEEGKGEVRDALTKQLAGIADIYVNDAFGSWQPHASTFDITRHLPSYIGFLLQNELKNLSKVLNPKRPFVAVVAGAKYDTKIGPLSAIYEKVDKLILGGVIYNTFLCAKYGIKVAGLSESDVEPAKDLVEKDKHSRKIVELPVLVESDVIDGRVHGKYRNVPISSFVSGKQYGYFLDAAPESFDAEEVTSALSTASTIFVNAVMGLTPHFSEGSHKLNSTIDKNRKAMKLFGGGDTLQELKNLNPGIYIGALDSDEYYFFTGGGTVLKAIEEGSPYGLEIVIAMIANKGKILA